MRSIYKASHILIIVMDRILLGTCMPACVHVISTNINLPKYFSIFCQNLATLSKMLLSVIFSVCMDIILYSLFIMYNTVKMFA